MSHFTVMIIGDDVEGKLYPYHELECTLTREEIKEDPRSEFIVSVKKDEIRQYIHDNMFMEKYGDRKGKRARIYTTIEHDSLFNTDKVVTHNEYIKKYYEYLKNKDYASIMDDWESSIQNEKTGDWGKYTNPNAKWNWYSVGGRWTGGLKLKKFENVPAKYRHLFEFTEVGRPGLMTDSAEDGWVDSAPKILIDWNILNNPTKEKYQEDYDFWTKYVIPCSKKEYESLSDDEKRKIVREIEKELNTTTWYKASFYKNRYKNRDTFIKLNNMFSTYAVITEDGRWHAPGEMGWWGMSSETDDDYLEFKENYFERFIEPLSPKTLITIVDCHI